MRDVILVLNAGSSSLEFSVFPFNASETAGVRGQIEALSTEPRFVARDADGKIIGQKAWPSGTRLGHEESIEFLLTWGGQGPLEGCRIVAVGHRVVHGGVRFTGPVLIDCKILAEIEALVSLAPLHQPHNIAAIRAAARHAPKLPQVACFDTSFHLTQPAVAQTFALPRRYTEQGIRRYGFHGLSCEYIASVLPAFDSQAAAGRTIVAHLGNGASMCALRAGQSIATTMGFTAVDGLVMGTRCGALDPGVVLHLISQERLSVAECEDLLYHKSGLLGISDISGDMRTLLGSHDPRAKEAVALFVYRVGRELGSLTAALEGLDALVFTGGIGENAASIRARICRGSAWLGLELDEAANERGGPGIAQPDSPVAAWVIATDEERVIADHTRRILEDRSSRTGGTVHCEN
ncbi:MAG TPA: acetate/propionate family kinase [Planctomycetaceae bacterium]|jgi:acetate kinase|nr:acetate/propionate family kinase [Planctomycetaceae bacterium]